MLGIGGTNMKLTKDHGVGIVIGLGVAAAGYFLYKKNKAKVDEFLRSQGINVPASNDVNYEGMSLEVLTETKEHIEDLIAEREENGKVDEEIQIEETIEEEK